MVPNTFFCVCNIISIVSTALLELVSNLAFALVGSCFFGKNEFAYDAKQDLYICPQGETLHRKGHNYKERSIRYAAKPSACNP
jgi:hypothetical protein